MTQRVEFGLPAGSLVGESIPRGRFAYSYWFVPLDNKGSNGRPVLTRTQFAYLARTAGVADGFEELWRRWHSADDAEDRTHWSFQFFLGGSLSHRPAPVRVEESADPLSVLVARPLSEVLLELLRSQIGLLFLDRTRIVPAGFAVGDHLYTLGLAPAEEVVLEQRSFLQDERSDETTTEKETSGENERTGSWSMEGAETIVGTETSTKTDGFTAGGSVGFDYGVKVGVQGQYSDGTTTADNDSRTTSTKNVVAGTTKNLAKTRDLHKTVFRLSSVQRFETSARRTVRNPNPHTPIDLHMFKVMQRLKFSHERYGARLCWTPFVKDPAGEFFAVETAMRLKLLAEADASVPAPQIPAQPVITGVPGSTVVGLDPPLTELAAWGGWPGQDMSHNYTLPINMPANMKWDGDVAFLQGSLHSTLTGASKGFHVECVGTPREVVGQGSRTVFQVVHAGATWDLFGRSQLFASLSARAIPDGASLAQAQADAMAVWEADAKRRRAEYAAAVQEARALAVARFVEWRDARRATLDGPRELLRRFIATMFPADARDEIAELDLWDQVFDWDLAAARLYSGSWNGDGSLRDPTLPPGDFVNASWARLFLPVRPGFEEVALRWIYLRSRSGQGPACVDELLNKVTTDLRDWRVENLGGPEEVTVTPVLGQACPDVVQKFVCLGTWVDSLPTDGVHVEVTQSPTTAADEAMAALSQAGLDRATALAASAAAGGDLRAALADVDLSGTDVHVHVDEPRD